MITRHIVELQQEENFAVRQNRNHIGRGPEYRDRK
jgi:hypothetical protein